MPFMEITYPQGALSTEARATLAEELTTIILHAERAPNTEFFRKVTWLHTQQTSRGLRLRWRCADPGADVQARREHPTGRAVGSPPQRARC